MDAKMLDQSITSIVGEDSATVEVKWTNYLGKEDKWAVVFDCSLRSLLIMSVKYTVVRLLQDRLRIKTDKKTGKVLDADKVVETKRALRKKVEALREERPIKAPISLLFKIFGKNPEDMQTRSKGNAEKKVRELVAKQLGVTEIPEEMWAGMKAMLAAQLAAAEKVEVDSETVELDEDEPSEK